MLTIIIKGDEVWDENKEEFSTINDVVLDLEHSLLSLSKWESKHQKPFLAGGARTVEEVYDYLKCMIITPGIDPDVLNRCPEVTINEIRDYIESTQSATTFGMMPERRGHGETITSELIYFWMVEYKIPFEVERWHLNRLFSLIRICNIKKSPPKKMSRHEILQRNRELNAQRRAQYGTSG